MRSGALRHTVDIERRTETSDAGGAVSVVWGRIATVRADVQPKGAEEHGEGGKVTGRQTFEVTIRYYSGLTAKDRLKFGSRALNITGIQNVGERNKEMLVTCVEDVT